MGRRKWIVIGAAALLFLLAAGLLLYPLLSARYAERHAAELQTEYLEQIEKTDKKTLKAALEAARRYNERIRPGVKDAFENQSLQSAAQDYGDLLNLTGNGLMGYVEIPEIGVNLPIYHGTAEETLQRGVGHLLGSSLPVGGESTHAVLSAHSGASSKLFTDLDRLEIGDVFRIRVLGETLAYRVDQIKTVLPYETDDLRVIDGKDYCTLSTCTPFGVNTHRLLVRGERVETPAQDGSGTPAGGESVREAGSTWDAMYVRAVLIGTGAAVLLAALAAAVLLLRRRRKRK